MLTWPVIGLIYALDLVGIRIASGAFGIGGIALAFAAQASRENAPVASV